MHALAQSPPIDAGIEPSEYQQIRSEGLTLLGPRRYADVLGCNDQSTISELTADAPRTTGAIRFNQNHREYDADRNNQRWHKTKKRSADSAIAV
jgi:hypothetical protein